MIVTFKNERTLKGENRAFEMKWGCLPSTSNNHPRKEKGTQGVSPRKDCIATPKFSEGGKKHDGGDSLGRLGTGKFLKERDRGPRKICSAGVF